MAHWHRDIEAAYARCVEIKARKDDEFFFTNMNSSVLRFNCLRQKKIDLAIDALELNIHVYPEHVDSYIEQAKFYLHKGEHKSAEKRLLKAQSIQPDNAGGYVEESPRLKGKVK